MKDMILYHGSRNGIKGKISPISRERCDFGKGFYMGEYPNQVKGLVCKEDNPYFYKLEFKLSEIPENKILVLKDQEWLYAVMACRNLIPEFTELPVAQSIIQKINNADVVIGLIADDQMNKVTGYFYREQILTDQRFKECLQFVKYGNQIVAKTDFACSKIKIIKEKELTAEEIVKAKQYGERKKNEALVYVRDFVKKYRRDSVGLFADEIIKQEKENPFTTLSNNISKNLEQEERDM